LHLQKGAKLRERDRRSPGELRLDGLKTDAKIVRYPGRYSDPRGERMWSVVNAILADLAAVEIGF
jgi:hypothetical protein